MKISVALCTFNGEKYLEQQIDSILNQNNNFDYEIIVCDDLSTDKTQEILNEYSNKFPYVFKIFINKTNLGSTKNFEKAISLCNGDYIFLADQDDLWHTEKVNIIINKFNENQAIDGVFTNADLINDKSEKFTNSKLWDNVFFLVDKISKPIDFIDLIFRNGNVVTGATLCIKKQVKEYIFPFSDKVLHDEWIATILAFKNKLDYINEDLISYRIHEKQQVGIKKAKKIATILHKKKIILGLHLPSNFNDYRFLIKKQFLKCKNIEMFKNSNFLKENLSQMESDSKQKLNDYIKESMNKFPFQHKFFNLIDKFLDKRQHS